MGSGAAIIIWIVVFFAIFYFLAIRPQKRQRQKHSEMVTMLKKGDEVVTIGGLYGTVSRIGDEWIELEIAKRTKARFLKRAISQITSVVEEDEEDEYIEAEVAEDRSAELTEAAEEEAADVPAPDAPDAPESPKA